MLPIRCSSVRGNDTAIARTSCRSTGMATAERTWPRRRNPDAGRGRRRSAARLVDDAGVREIVPVTAFSPRHGHDHERTAHWPSGTDDGGAAEWDARYAAADKVWSGNPNGALLTEVTGLRPGRALDVGCGEGADAVWLAGHGWEVTALDVSQVALDRAALHARQAGVQVRWVRAGLVEASLSPGAFDLVSAQYPALRRTPTGEAERALLAAVAPGGLLLVVHHEDVDVDHARAHGFDPADYVQPADVAALLDDDWHVEVDETRPRTVEAGAGAGHTLDRVLRARRAM
jgi:SAM-dependent methyltransferase